MRGIEIFAGLAPGSVLRDVLSPGGTGFLAAGGLVQALVVSGLLLILLALVVGLRSGQRSRNGVLDPGVRPAPRPPDTARPGREATSAGQSAGRRGSSVGPGVLSAVRSAAYQICTAFEAWLAEHGQEPDLWLAFDQLVRELLTEHLTAGRVRCYHVRPGAETLQTISQEGKSPGGKGPALREGVLGHTATSGREYVAYDPSHGPLIDDLAAQADETWTWVWPVREGRATIGIIAVGSVTDATRLTAEMRLTVGELLTLCWQHVACREQLLVLSRTDRATGVLTRSDFFGVAGRALADSYAASEPVVLATLTIEGLRRLDDTGRWQQRDALVEHIGRLAAARVRADDLVGRFSDDRFVVLLRRLDSGLGRLIAEKILAKATECLAEAEEPDARLRVRVGLVGSGFGQPSLETLLAAAFETVDRARKQGVDIATDLEQRPVDKPAPPQKDANA